MMPYIDPETGLYRLTNDPESLLLGIENPADIAAFVMPDTFELPFSNEAMQWLRRLQLGGVGGLESLLTTDTEAQRQAYETALYDRAAESINREADRLSLDINASNFGRGMGLSTWNRERLGDVTREKMDALGRARREAFLGAGTEQRANQAAQLSALGQAFSQGTAGLQAEANVGETNTGREQQARQYAATQAFSNLLNRLQREQQAGQFGAELGSREFLQQQGYQAAQNIASENRIASGLGAGLGGLANVFGPSLNTALQNMWPDLFRSQLPTG